MWAKNDSTSKRTWCGWQVVSLFVFVLCQGRATNPIRSNVSKTNKWPILYYRIPETKLTPVVSPESLESRSNVELTATGSDCKRRRHFAGKRIVPGTNIYVVSEESTGYRYRNAPFVVVSWNKNSIRDVSDDCWIFWWIFFPFLLLPVLSSAKFDVVWIGQARRPFLWSVQCHRHSALALPVLSGFWIRRDSHAAALRRRSRFGPKMCRENDCTRYHY